MFNDDRPNSNPSSPSSMSMELSPSLNHSKTKLEIISSPTGYVSLLDTSEIPDSSESSSTFRPTLNFTRTFGTFRQWTLKTFETTRQFFQEKFGYTHRTVDPEIEQQIQALQETKRHYQILLTQAKQLSSHFSALLQLQRDFSESLNEIQRLSMSSDDLNDQIIRNSQCHKMLANHGDSLLKCLNHFVDKLQTLICYTMDDTFRTIKIYENARYEYDALRGDYELIPNGNPTETNDSSIPGKNPLINERYRQSRQRYEKAKDDLTIKFKLLDQYRIELMKQELIALHQSIGAYFSLNRQQLNL